MKLLVTGGYGFIGSNFILHTLKNYPKIKVTNLDAMLMGSNKKNLKNIKKEKIKNILGNINNKKIIKKLVNQNDVIVNFAAETHVDRSIDDASPFLKSNIIGIHTILEEVTKRKKKLIQISTDEVYGSLKKGSASEDSCFNPSNPYSASKASAELLVKSYIETYDCNANITRCTNNFGPMQSPEKLIPKVIMLAQENKKIPIYGTGKNVRDWIYVEDHCSSIWKIILDGKRGNSYNIAGKNELNNIAIVKQILKIMDKSLDLISYTKDRPGHDFRYSLDSSKIEKQLKWKRKYSFERGLKGTIDWYLRNQDWSNNISKKIISAYSWKTR
jgi:dTDP-glucose 4,6-dehydratase